jgi:hypothetical protein
LRTRCIASKCTARLDFDRKQLKVVQAKQRPLRSTFGTLDSDSKNTSKPKTSGLSFNGQPLPTGAGGDFDNRYSQRGVQWAVKQVQKQQE